MLDPDDPYRFFSVRGEVTDVTEDGAVAHVDRLARRNGSVEEYPDHGEERSGRSVVRVLSDRVVGHIRPDHVVTS